MKGIYLTECDTSDLNSGVSKKINYQIDSFIKQGGEITLIDKRSVSSYGRSILLSLLYNLFGINSRLVLKQLNLLKTLLHEGQYDFIYVRQILFDNKLVSVLKEAKIKNPRLKVLFEIPTYPYDLEMHLSQQIMLINDKIARKHLTGAIDRIVTYSKDSCIFNIPTIVIPNGISFRNIKLRTPMPHNGINFVAVALFDKWHGYDRFIRGMGEQMDIVVKNDIHLYLAGGGKSVKQYKAIAASYKLENYVHFCGELHGEELESLYSISDIALDSMGRHRVKVYYNSTLKGKEYCAHGIPMVSGVETELDKYPDFKYYFRIPSDETSVDMGLMVNYYHRIYENNDAVVISSLIRKKTESLFDFSIAYKPVTDYVINY